MNFVFVSLQRINTARESTSTSLAKELAKNHNVLFVNSPIDRRTFYSKNNDCYTQAHKDAVKQKSKNNLHRLENNLWVLNPSSIIESINWLPLTRVFNLLNWYNNLRFAKDIEAAVQKVGFSSYILVNDKDIFRSFYLKEILKPAKYIYLDRDFTVGIDYWRKHGVSLEPKLMAKADAVVCNSNDFVKRAQKYNPKSYYIGNGFDAAQFAIREHIPIPKELAKIPYPVIGYVGALVNERLNLDLIIKVARARPTWNFVFIGWEDEVFSKSELHRLKNVYMLGNKHTHDVPSYIKHFNVCINPQILNEITRGNFPLKIVEYLSLGKPVVATTTNTMKEVFEDVTYLSETSEGYMVSIQQALEEDNNKKMEIRKEFVKQFTWEKVTEAFLDAIEVDSSMSDGE